MSMKIIQRASYGESVSYHLEYRYQDLPSAGFSFSCDEEGNHQNPNEAAIENLRLCRLGSVRGEAVVFEGLQKREHTYRIPAVGLCVCGEHVSLGSFTNTCGCGRDYNSAGQQLADRSQWGEETGEHWSDIINA